jgi:ATP-dependent helicase/DNAse subunit B
MAAKVHILCGPAGSGKTGRLLERYREVVAQAIGAALWLGPTRRGVESVRERLVPASGALLAPNLITFQEFAEEVIRVNEPTSRPLANVQRRLLADTLVADLHARGELSHFARVVDTRGFSEGVFGLLAELKRNEIWPAQFARAAYARGCPEPLAARTIRGRRISSKDRQCARIYARYQRLLIRHQLFDLEGRFWYARDLLARGCRRPFESVRAVFVDGFTDFTRTEREILESLCSWVRELWVTLPEEPGDERAELFTKPRATLERMEPLRPRIEHLARASAEMLPAGLAHVERQLFRPPRAICRSDNADGIRCLEAPGMLGETRLLAREIKVLLVAGTPAEEILIAVRDVVSYADLVREVFGEYGIPVDVEGAEPLHRSPTVATLLRALRLPDEDWPFAGLTALLRSGFLRPSWSEVTADPEVAGQAEVLLRLLGEPRGRASYLNAVRRWAREKPKGLEDEAAEESRRQRTHELAIRCQSFLERFFQAWDAAPSQSTLAEHTAWLGQFATDLGIPDAATPGSREAQALDRLWKGLAEWNRLEREVHGTARRYPRTQFLRMLGALTAETGLARTPRGPGRVRVLSAALARELDVPYLFVMGLGERSFPRLTPPEPFFDEQERQAFKQVGLDFLCLGDRMPDEMLLFYQLVTRARRQLTLSYPAVDDKGQHLLPSSFLSALFDCFTPDAILRQQQRMLIEGYGQAEPRSFAEYRVSAALRIKDGFPLPDGLPSDLRANLAAAAEMYRLRMRTAEYNPYDGLLRHPMVVGELAQRFGPEKVFSPTALEQYIACPFRFFLGNVLGLEPLEEPTETIEVTRRGQAFHRALSRLHTGLKKAGVEGPTDAVDAAVLARLAEAVEEDAARAPSPASQMLWRLEGKRLEQSAARYREHWRNFIGPWLPHGTAPRPHFFEVDFGLPGADGKPGADPLIIRTDGVEVRIRGRIDRVDIADLPDGVGFWIIDYKTGRSQHYTAKDLQEFRKLQLTLYALAVEQVLLAGQQARPLGMAYWLVTENGPKIALPGRNTVLWLEETAAWREVRERLERWVASLVADIRQGYFPLHPRSDDCTQTCDYPEVCRIAQARSAGKVWERLTLPVCPK